MEFKEKLILLRKSRGMSQQELADEIGVSRQAVSKWEVGSASPSLDNVNAISNIVTHIKLEF